MDYEPDARTDRLANEIIGAAIEVHRSLGPGFLESVYEEALCIELELRRISFNRQHVIGVRYKGRSVGESRLDLLVDGSIIVELKAVETLLPIHTAQLLSYLRATGCSLGLLMNFNLPILKPVLSASSYRASAFNLSFLASLASWRFIHFFNFQVTVSRLVHLHGFQAGEVSMAWFQVRRRAVPSPSTSMT